MRRYWILTVTLMTIASEPLPADWSVACRLEVEPDPRITAHVLESIKSSLDRCGQAVLGSDGAVRWVRDELALDLLEDVGLKAVSAAWKSRDRLIWLQLRRTGGEYVFRCREFDPNVKRLSRVFELRTAQREMIPDTAGRLFLKVLTPIAHVVGRDAEVVRIRFEGGARFAQHRRWLGIHDKAGLQIIQPGAKRNLFSRTFLRVQRWNHDLVECELVGRDNLEPALIESGNLIALPARAANGNLQVRVVRQDSRLPQEGCEVFLSKDDYSTIPARSCGITNQHGIVDVDIDQPAVLFIAVQYEDLVLKAPVLPGAVAEPVQFQLPTNGRRGEFVRPLRRLQRALSDQVHRDNQLVAQLKENTRNKDPRKIEQLVTAAAKKRLRFAETAREIKQIERAAAKAGEDVSKLAAQVLGYAESATRPLQLAEFAEYSSKLRKVERIKELAKEIEALEDQKNWFAAVKRYEELALLDPDNTNLASKLRRFKRDLQVQNQAHEDARKTVDALFSGLKLADLADRWAEVTGPTRTLLAAKDGLWLLKVYENMLRWRSELSERASQLTAQIENAEDELAAEGFQRNYAELGKLYQSWKQEYEPVEQFLKENEFLN